MSLQNVTVEDLLEVDGVRNAIQALNIDPQCIETRLHISEQEVAKSAIKRYLANSGYNVPSRTLSRVERCVKEHYGEGGITSARAESIAYMLIAAVGNIDLGSVEKGVTGRG